MLVGYYGLFYLWFCLCLQAKYDDIKKVVKAASEGPMKGFLGYTEDQVCSQLSLFLSFYFIL